MNKLISDLIPLLCGLYFLLIAKGIVKLSQDKQAKFEEYMKSKKRFMIIVCYALIIISIALIVKDLN